MSRFPSPSRNCHREGPQVDTCAGIGPKYVNGRGGPSLTDRVTALRVMEGRRGNARRVSYHNGPQKVHPRTGRAVSRKSPWAHIPGTLSSFVGEELAAVCFVRNYLELHFDGHNLHIGGIHTYHSGELKLLAHNCAVRNDNLSPLGAGRRGAFRQAKRDAGIPVSAQPSATVRNVDKRGRVQPGRQYVGGVKWWGHQWL